MKNIFIFFGLLFLFISAAFSQVAKNAGANMFETELLALSKSESPVLWQKFYSDYDLIKKDGEWYVGIAAIVNKDVISTSELKSLGVLNDTKLNELWTFRVPLVNYFAFTSLAGLKYIEIAEPVEPFLELDRPSARVDSVHEGLGGLMQAYTGKGVVVAIIDWGFDYSHPTFFDSTLTNYRVSRAWDQNKFDGTPPNGYNFGAEYIGETALLEAAHDTNYVFGYSSHGSHVGGIAAGSGGGGPYIGAAPDAELIFISLRRDAPSFIDAISYVTNYAAMVNKPYVVNMSFGSHLGPHDGTDLKNFGIDILHGPGKVFVGSAGNNGTPGANFHLDYDFSTNPDDTIKTVVNFSNPPGSFGQTLSMWGSENSSFGVSIALSDEHFNVVHQTPYYHASQEPNFIDTLLLGGDTLIIRVATTASFFLNNKPNIRMEIKNTSANRVVLHATSVNSHLHIWNNVRMNNRYTNWGVALTSNFPDAIAGDNDYGLGEPAGCGKNVITVASYRAKFFTLSGNALYGNISNFSSFGPTVDERVKPDIASTGQSVWSSVNSYDITQNHAHPIEMNGREYGFAVFSGTSMSGPMVAGIVALMLEANPVMSATQAKEILKETARLDEFTGNIGPNGHLQWGWGKANALAAVKAAEVLASDANLTMDQMVFDLFPNPATDFVNIKVNDDSHNGISDIVVYDLQGKEWLQEEAGGKNELKLSVSDLPAGTYLVLVKTKGAFGVKKMVVGL
ncbi:MAG: S8 family peptidase [Crocinitomicaceae bacterium]|nr:S8 family peptidase [Crocinitomicaceae bacterium]